MAKYESLRNAFGNEVVGTVRNARVLVVGAGGIGCELLKTLVLTGFTDIHAIDLDTIDVSNLNRQFLFRKHHVGEPKSTVACKVVKEFNSDAEVHGFHGNIKSTQYGVEFFKKFDIVMNALDNLEARTHVNHICMALSIPLIESGTKGFNGQVQPIVRNELQCYNCNGQKKDQTTYAVCTIRSSPSKLVHCVVYGKLLYERIFGIDDDEDDPIEWKETSRVSGELCETPVQLAIRTYNKIFNSIISKLLEEKEIGNVAWTCNKPVPLPEVTSYSQTQTFSTYNTSVLTTVENTECYIQSFCKLMEQKNISGKVPFSKDDDNAMLFVSAIANLRAEIFSIPNDSPFKVKSIAGNIVPAIATTNAIVSGVMVLQAIQVLQKTYSNCKLVYITSIPKTISRKPAIVYPTEAEKPNPNCATCVKISFCKINIHKVTMKQFVHDVLISKLALEEPCIDIGARMLYEFGETDERTGKNGELIVERVLAEFGIIDATAVSISDLSSEGSTEMWIFHTEGELELNGIDSLLIKSSKPGTEETPVVEEEGDDLILYNPKEQRELLSMATDRRGVKRSFIDIEVL